MTSFFHHTIKQKQSAHCCAAVWLLLCLLLDNSSHAFPVVAQPSSHRESHNSLKYSSPADPPLDKAEPSFTKRILGRITTAQSRPTTKTARKKIALVRPPPVREVTQLGDLHEAVNDRVTVVLWYAPWCRACHRVAPRLARLAMKMTGTGSSSSPSSAIQFVQVSDPKMHVGFAIPSVPYMHVYLPGQGLVEELKVSAKTWDYEPILQSYVDGQCHAAVDEDNCSSETGNVYEAPYKRLS